MTTCATVVIHAVIVISEKNFLVVGMAWKDWSLNDQLIINVVKTLKRENDKTVNHVTVRSGVESLDILLNFDVPGTKEG